MSGPAVTLNVTYRQHNMDIDLVAVFRITGDKWPAYPVRQNSNRIWKDFLVVPKSPKDVSVNAERYWRLSFPEQEREMIRRLNYCKPALRLLKKLRDVRRHNIPSYFIKTVFLWEIEEREKNNSGAFWDSSLTKVFLHMLVTYKNYLERHEIPYFWNENNNFLDLLSPINIMNIKNYLDRMINTINKNIDCDPYIVARFLLSTAELGKLHAHFNNDLQVLKKEEDVLVRHFMPEPRAYLADNSGLQQQEEPGISTGTLVAGAAAVGIGAAILGGLFAYARSQRNQNN